MGGADAQIVAASPATDVMDDENDKVSQDVVAVPLGSGIHEFQWSQAWRSGLLCSALMSQLGGEGLAGHQGMSAEHALVPISLTLNSLSNGPQTISMTFSHPHLSPRL